MHKHSHKHRIAPNLVPPMFKLVKLSLGYNHFKAKKSKTLYNPKRGILDGIKNILFFTDRFIFYMLHTNRTSADA
jgi:hypothetical protein